VAAIHHTKKGVDCCRVRGRVLYAKELIKRIHIPATGLQPERLQGIFYPLSPKSVWELELGYRRILVVKRPSRAAWQPEGGIP
jgi:hypothetical protein